MSERYEAAVEGIREAARATPPGHKVLAPGVSLDLHLARTDLESLAGILVSKGVISQDELDGAMAYGMEKARASFEDRVAASVREREEAEERMRLEREAAAKAAVEAWADEQRQAIELRAAEKLRAIKAQASK